VLYHTWSPNGPAAKTLETPEGHTVEYDDQTPISGSSSWRRTMLDRNEELQLTGTRPPAVSDFVRRSGLNRPAVSLPAISTNKQSAFSRRNLLRFAADMK